MTDRGVSVAVNYTITLIIATLVLGGLLMAAGGLIESQSQTAINDEMDVLGQNIGANLMSADRMVSVDAAESTAVDEVYVRVELPRRVGGSSYMIDIPETGADEKHVVLRSTDPDVTVTVTFTTEVDVAETTVPGGPIAIEYDDSAEELAVSAA